MIMIMIMIITIKIMIITTIIMIMIMITTMMNDDGSGEWVYQLRRRLHHLCLVPHLLCGEY